MIDFPIAPGIGDRHNAAGLTWEWQGDRWDLVPSLAGASWEGWFDPTAPNGQGTSLYPIINGTDNYREDDWVIADITGTYNFDTGQPDAGGTLVEVSSFCRYRSGVWQVLPR